MLRGIDSKVPSLRTLFEELCFGNKYTTTLHAINSAIVKLSKLTKATKVYRGLSGRGLPHRARPTQWYAWQRKAPCPTVPTLSLCALTTG